MVQWKPADESLRTSQCCYSSRYRSDLPAIPLRAFGIACGNARRVDALIMAVLGIGQIDQKQTKGGNGLCIRARAFNLSSLSLMDTFFFKSFLIHTKRLRS